MNRFAKLFRVISGLLLLTNLIIFFLPILVISQDNYSTIRYSQFDFVKKLFEKGIANLGKGLSAAQIAIIVFLIILPLVLSFIIGVIGVAGSVRQFISGIGSVLVLGLNIVFYFNLHTLEPKRVNDVQVYEKGVGLWLLLSVSAAAAVFGVAGLMVTPRKKKRTEKAVLIPDVAQMKQEQMLPEKQFTDEAKEKADSAASLESLENQQQISDPVWEKGDSPRGVMVGLTGNFQGAEIPFQSGETLKLGRDLSNDLVFANAKRVSRFHCSLTWLEKEQKYQIVDKSSNGSFVDGREECIPQNMAIYLEPGTVLDIGSKENRFRLE